MPILSMSLRKILTHMLWNVEIQMSSAPGPRMRSTRSFISLAALFVNVIAKMFHGATLVSDVYKDYQKKLRKNQSLDFDDLIMTTIILFDRVPEVLEYYQRKFQYIHVDEYQDTNRAQYLLGKKMAQRFENICVVGDHDQIVKIERLVFPQFFLIIFVDIADDLFKKTAGCFLVLFRVDQFVFRTADRSEYASGIEFFRIDVSFL